MEFKALSHFSNKPTVRILVHVSLRTGTRVIFRSGITELNDMHALNFTRFCPIAFQMVLPNYTQHKEPWVCFPTPSPIFITVRIEHFTYLNGCEMAFLWF